MWNSLKIACVVTPCVVVALLTRLHATPASDNAGQSAYTDGWQAGDNGGVGFMPWVLAFSGDPSAIFYSPDHSSLTRRRGWQATRLVRRHSA